MKNSIFTIRPYKRGSVWVFDEPQLDLLAEPFCGDINKMIDAMLLRADLPASEPFTGMFSAYKFPGVHMHLKWQREESGGNWYADITHEPRVGDYVFGWLCPALFKFFCEAPKNIYVRAEE